jgi:molybdopterin synthase catalytic subunit
VSVSLQSETIDVAAEYTQLVGDRPGAAVATFTGYVRDHSDQHAVAELELEHYPEMARKVLEDLGQLAAERFELSSWRIVHRFGRLAVLDTIVWGGGGCGSPGRGHQCLRINDGHLEDGCALLEARAGTGRRTMGGQP